MKSFSKPKIDLKRKATELLTNKPGQTPTDAAIDDAPTITTGELDSPVETTTVDAVKKLSITENLKSGGLLRSLSPSYTSEPQAADTTEAADVTKKPSLFQSLPTLPIARTTGSEATEPAEKPSFAEAFKPGSLLCSPSILKSPSETVEMESVYIVLRPLELNKAPEQHLKQLGRVVKAVQFEEYLLLQHWGVLIGHRYYHLHLDDKTKLLSVSMVPFRAFDPEKRDHTIKFPIWRTGLTHDERVGIAVGIIKAMGNFKQESEVEIRDENDQLVQDRTRYTMEGRYAKRLLDVRLFSGRYNPLTNNCIHFTKNFVFDQLLQRSGELARIPENVAWLVNKWREMGCKKSPTELYQFLAGILGIANPFNMTPERGAKLVIKLLSIYLDIEWHSSVDEEKLADDLIIPESVATT